MKLNRNNYEEYFILYMDNELSGEDRHEVEVFLQENPDLKAEMDLLLQSRLVPDQDIRFADKGSLMRFDSASLHRQNYEEWLLSYIDHELDPDQVAELENFLLANPGVRKELELLQKTKLQAEPVVFPYKDSLYRSEEKVRVITMKWWRIAAAAVLLIGLATTVALVGGNRSSQTEDPAIATQKSGKGDVNTVKTQPGIIKKDSSATIEQPQKVNDENLAEHSPRIHENTEAEKDAVVPKQPLIAHVNKAESTPVVIPEKVLVDPGQGQTTIVKADLPKKDNGLPKPDQNPNVFSATDNPVAGSVPGDNSELTKAKLNSKSDPVTTSHSDTYHQENGADTKADQQAVWASETNSKSHKGIRGFLRKVTRTFEKRTNIKATDDDDRLLIAGLSIKLN